MKNVDCIRNCAMFVPSLEGTHRINAFYLGVERFSDLPSFVRLLFFTCDPIIDWFICWLGYRGVICGMDPFCCESNSWVEAAKIVKLDRGPNQPFYQVNILWYVLISIIPFSRMKNKTQFVKRKSNGKHKHRGKNTLTKFIFFPLNHFFSFHFLSFPSQPNKAVELRHWSVIIWNTTEWLGTRL